MLQKKVNICLETLNIKNVYSNIHLYPNVYTKIKIDNKNTKKSIKILNNICKNITLDTMFFYIDFGVNKGEDKNVVYTHLVLNKIIDIAKLSKPESMKKIKYKNIKNNTIDRVYFYWNIDSKKIKNTKLFEKILLLEDNELKKHIKNIYFLSTKNNIMCNLSNYFNIFAQNNDVLKNIYIKYKKIIV